MILIEVCENVQELRKMLEGCGSLNSRINKLALEGVELEKYLEALDIVEGHLRARIEERRKIEEAYHTSVPQELEASELAPDYEPEVADSVL